MLISCSRNLNVFYTNDNVEFIGQDTRTVLNCFYIDSCFIDNYKKNVSVICGDITERSFSIPASIKPCRVFIPQLKKDFKIVDNKFEIEIEEGEYDILVYSISGNSIYHHIFASEGKQYSCHYQLGGNSLICRKSEMKTDTFANKYYGDPIFFFNASDTVCFGGSILDKMVVDSNLLSGFGCLSLDVYKREINDKTTKKNKLKVRLLIPDMFLTKELTEKDTEILLPEGYHNVFIVSDGFFPYAMKKYIQNRMVYKMNVFLGFSTINCP